MGCNNSCQAYCDPKGDTNEIVTSETDYIMAHNNSAQFECKSMLFDTSPARSTAMNTELQKLFTDDWEQKNENAIVKI